MGLPLRGRLTVVRPATDDDADLLVGWHADPEVSRYWDDETFTRDEVLARLQREPVDAWIVEADGGRSGYLQSWWEDDEPRRGGLDGFLVPGARGRGLMPDAARVLARVAARSGLAVRHGRSLRVERRGDSRLGEGRLRRGLSHGRAGADALRRALANRFGEADQIRSSGRQPLSRNSRIDSLTESGSGAGHSGDAREPDHDDDADADALPRAGDRRRLARGL